MEKKIDIFNSFGPKIVRGYTFEPPPEAVLSSTHNLCFRPKLRKIGKPGMLMHAIMKFRMRRRDRYEFDVPHPLPLDRKYHMFCSRENTNKSML